MLERKGGVSGTICRSSRTAVCLIRNAGFSPRSGPRRGVMSGLPLPEWNRSPSRLRKSGHGAGSEDQIDLDRVAEIERETRHDVMAHIHHYGEMAPGAPESFTLVTSAL